MKEYIRLYWYEKYTPEDYQRTYSLLRSIKYKIVENSVQIYMDSNALEYHLTTGWGQHVGFDGSNFGNGLLEFIENGVYNSGKTGSMANPRIGDGSNFFSRTVDYVNQYAKANVLKKLEYKLGVKIKSI